MEHPPDGTVVDRGSGFLVSERGLIVTNHHVVRKGYRGHVILSDRTRLPVLGAVALDKGADLAIIKVAGKVPTRPLELAEDGLPPVGAKVYAIGTPLGFLANTLSDGLVSGHREDGRITHIQ